MSHHFDNLKPAYDANNRSMNNSFRGDFSPVKSQNRSQNRTMSHIQQTDQQNSEHYSIDILKPDAVKAIIREEIVNKGYDTIDFAQFLAKFQRGSIHINYFLRTFPFPLFFLICIEKGPSDDRWTLVKLLEVLSEYFLNIDCLRRLFLSRHPTLPYHFPMTSPLLLQLSFQLVAIQENLLCIIFLIILMTPELIIILTLSMMKEKEDVEL